MGYKGYLNSQTVVSALLMLAVYLATLFVDNESQIVTYLVAVAPAWLAPAVGHLVQAVAAVLGVFLTARTVQGRVKAGKEPAPIKGIWKKS